MKRLLCAIAAALIICTITQAHATDVLVVSGPLTEVWAYYGTVEVSAYYPGECGDVNHRGVDLSELAGEIIATQTKGGHAELLGKTVMLVTPDGETLIRKVDDRGCYGERLDLLVEDAAEMRAWGLAQCEVWVLEGKK